MKKALSLLLALVICLSLCACGEDQGTNSQSPNESNTNQPEEEALIMQNPNYGTYINMRRFNELMTIVELTTENWMEYIEVCSYTVVRTQKDDFGEIISTEAITHYELGAKGNTYYNLRDFVIELKDKTTGELQTYKENNDSYVATVEEGFSLDAYECTRIKGTLYLVDIPEEAIIHPQDGHPYFNVDYSYAEWYPLYSCYIYGRRIGGMFDFFVYD